MIRFARVEYCKAVSEGLATDWGFYVYAANGLQLAHGRGYNSRRGARRGYAALKRALSHCIEVL